MRFWIFFSADRIDHQVIIAVDLQAKSALRSIGDYNYVIQFIQKL